MKTIKIPLSKANETKKFLIDNDLLDKDYPYAKENGFIFFPVRSDMPGYEIVQKDLKRRDRESSLRKRLEAYFTPDELGRLKTSYDIIGDIAILEIDPEFSEKEEIIGKTLLGMQNNIHTVLKKAGMHSGEFRIQNLAYLAGEKKTETVHVENRVRLKLDVAEVYYSPRSSAERKRVMGLVKDGETVLVMFSGCGPFVFAISKNTKAKEVIGIEKNPVGHKYALENMALNKAKNVRLYEGDVREVLMHLDEKYDRILMPLPRSADEFLDLALSVAKKKTVIHFYDFLDDADIPDKAISKIDKACKDACLKYEVLGHVRCGQFSPGTFRVCVDFCVM